MISPFWSPLVIQLFANVPEQWCRIIMNISNSVRLQSPLILSIHIFNALDRSSCERSEMHWILTVTRESELFHQFCSNMQFAALIRQQAARHHAERHDLLEEFFHGNFVKPLLSFLNGVRSAKAAPDVHAHQHMRLATACAIEPGTVVFRKVRHGRRWCTGRKQKNAI